MSGAGGSHSSNNIYCNSINSPDSIGRRRKKRTSIESTVRIALERAFSQGQEPKLANRVGSLQPGTGAKTS